MTKIKKLATKLFISILIILAFFTAQNFLLFNNVQVYSNTITQTSALNLASQNDASNQEDLTSKITNNSFSTTSTGSSSTSSSSYTGNSNIKVPSSWTKQGTVNADDENNLFIGVIDVSDEAYLKYHEAYNLGASSSPYLSNMKDETNVLMLNSKKNKLFGYSSSSITLDANSFYAISVNFYTGNTTTSLASYDNPIASIALNGDDFKGNANAIITDVQTNKSWGTATIWVATNQTKKSTATLSLYLGKPAWQSGSYASESSGYVFFDNAKLLKLSKNYFNEQFDDVTKTINSDYKKLNFNSVVDLRYDDITSGNDGYVENGNLSSADSWTVEQTSASAVRFVNARSDNFGINAPLTNERSDDLTVAMIYNEKYQTASGSITSNPITIKSQQIYRISFWAKTNASSFVASIEPTDKINGKSYSAVSISSVSTNTQKTTNDWNEYAFFVKGNALLDAQVQIKLGLSSTNPTTNQYAFFDNITSQKVTSGDQSTASDSGITSVTLNLNPSADGLTIKNGYFNDANSIGTELTYPLTPSEWTWSKKSISTSYTNFSGIVNLKSDLFNAYKTNFGNPNVRPNSSIYSADSTNNVLIMANTTTDVQEYTSDSSISASANTNYVLNVNICTTNVNTTTSGANIYITNSDGVIIAQMLDLQTNGIWKTYSIYFGNGATAQTLTLSIGFGRETKPVYGFAYFDDITWDSTSESLENIEETSSIQVINLNQTIDNTESTIYTDDFSAYDKSVVGQISSPYYWTGSVKTNADEEETVSDDSEIVSGIINENNIAPVLSNKPIASSLSKNALMIYSPTETYYAFENNLTFSLDAESYYRITVNVKTISENNENTFASIIIKDIDKSFTEIQTNGRFKATDSDWLEYTIYINLEESIDLEINLGLGNSDTLSSGYVFFDDLKIVKLSEEQFTVDMDADLANTSKSGRVISAVHSHDDGDSDTPSSRTYSESLAWLSIPTILIAVGIIAAIIGYCIKRYIKSRPVKVKVQNSYDRSATLLQDLDHKNYKTSVNHKLKLLRDELEQTQKYLEEEKSEYQKQTDAYETAKEIAEHDNNIKLENPNKKKSDYQARVNQLEKNIAAIKADISILEKEQERLKKEETKKHADDLKGNKITTRK